ncbi:response regulator transcription factor [Paenibacillus aceris]|uniref:Two-component system response regulator YesN n=1 Tax=Paenibacillus aceris TaxID=869555 RepID=A0ABS4I4Q4_9BACL|nr:response regulator [Paenibacillus aceris]MBP1965501.1 two-component system response regulator YesN [Paenibacillus aceris]NHW33450.1 response regulator [Paenibacillus aceris]
MWNMLVVEDESIVRVGLRYMVNWESLGVFWKAEASNGEEALRVMETGEIHFVVTDIRMPGMDGLELARQIKLRYPLVQIIFLSSYDDFSYAKEAIRLGAIDFLHKPTMDEDEIAEVLRKTVSTLEETVQTAKPPYVTEDDRNQYLLSLLDVYTFPQSPLISEFETYDDKQGYWLTVIRKRGDAMTDASDAEHLRFLSLQYMVDEIVTKDWGGVVFHRHYREIIWIAPASPRAAAIKEVEKNKYLESVRQKLLHLLSVSIVYSISSPYEHITDLPKAYMESLLRLPVNEQSDNLIVRMAKEMVDRCLLEDITLIKVAADIHVSSGYLSRVFLKEVGENFSDYVIRNKLEYAQKLLRQTNKKVYEIAADIGYMNPHYFSKLFKERFGIPPLEYRNQ